MNADTILIFIFFGLMIAGLVDYAVSTESEEVKQFEQFIENWIDEIKRKQ